MDDHVPHHHHEEVVEVHVPSSNSRSIGTTHVEAPSSRSASSKKSGDSKKASHSAKNGANELLMVNDQKGNVWLAGFDESCGGGFGKWRVGVGLQGCDGREEKLLISEYIPKGSLLYVLHGDRGISHSELKWPIRVKIIQGVASGMEFLHTEFAAYDLPHGNLKSSNILLKEDYEPVLNDYAFHPLINPSNAAQAMFAFKTPEYIDSQQISPKSDVYCLGIVILEILTGKFPSQYLSNGKGGIDVVAMGTLLQIGTDCTDSNPDRRPDIREAIRRILEVQV
ncbi:hypothetical protein M0R45_003708 [Rubus argutus]|uniref:Protein kinase domain-containing protein n=1 Tax=Rubus argutus TaxID=59490 RepID=A0AAW1YI59_RUBAR